MTLTSEYLRLSLARYVAMNGGAIAAEIGDVAKLEAKALSLLSALDPRPEKTLVHGDYLPGNVLVDDHFRVTGVVDFSFYTVVGDPVLDAAGAAICLEMTGSPPVDVRLVRRLVAERYGPGIAPSLRFYRAYSHSPWPIRQSQAASIRTSIPGPSPISGCSATASRCGTARAANECL